MKNVIDLCPYINGTEAAVLESTHEKKNKRNKTLDVIMFSIETIVTVLTGMVMIAGIIICVGIIMGIL